VNSRASSRSQTSSLKFGFKIQGINEVGTCVYTINIIIGLSTAILGEDSRIYYHQVSATFVPQQTTDRSRRFHALLDRINLRPLCLNFGRNTSAYGIHYIRSLENL